MCRTSLCKFRCCEPKHFWTWDFITSGRPKRKKETRTKEAKLHLNLSIWRSHILLEMQFGDLYKSTAKKEYHSRILALPRQAQNKCVHPIYEIKLLKQLPMRRIEREEERSSEKTFFYIAFSTIQSTSQIVKSWLNLSNMWLFS